MSTHIGVSPITGRIFQGRANKAGTAFIGDKKDVTSQVLRAVIEKSEYHGGVFDIEGDGNKWIVTVTRLIPAYQPTAPATPAALNRTDACCTHPELPA